jgi:hypothetical protein
MIPTALSKILFLSRLFLELYMHAKVRQQLEVHILVFRHGTFYGEGETLVWDYVKSPAG